MRRELTVTVEVRPGPTAEGYDPTTAADLELSEFFPRVPPGHFRREVIGTRDVSLTTREVRAVATLTDEPAGAAAGLLGTVPFVPWPRLTTAHEVRRSVTVSLEIPEWLHDRTDERGERLSIEEEVSDYLPPLPSRPGLYLAGIHHTRELYGEAKTTIAYTVAEVDLGRPEEN
jgi:hypothetical protein